MTPNSLPVCRTLDRLAVEPLAIITGAFGPMLRRAIGTTDGHGCTRILEPGAVTVSKWAELVGLEGDDLPHVRLERIGAVGVVKVRGPMYLDADEWDVLIDGASDYRDIQAALSEAAADPNVLGVLLDLDTPGGSVLGMEETAQAIAGLNKPVVAYTDHLAASAGYALGIHADAFYASNSAQVGSIGTIISLLDVSGYFEQMGVKAEVFASGDLKATGSWGLSLSESQRAYLQEQVQVHGAEFRAMVTNLRGVTDDNLFRGQTFTGREAEANGLVDATMSREQAFQELQALVGLAGR